MRSCRSEIWPNTNYTFPAYSCNTSHALKSTQVESLRISKTPQMRYGEFSNISHSTQCKAGALSFTTCMIYRSFTVLISIPVRAWSYFIDGLDWNHGWSWTGWSGRVQYQL